MNNDAKQSVAPETHGRQIDFAPANSTSSAPVESTPNSTVNTPPQTTSLASQSQPTPVTSAKAVINAMYAAGAGTHQPSMVTSAREAVNAAASQNSLRNQKSAANLHHGSIQKSMESTRTSASSLLRIAKNEQANASPTNRKTSSDPLSRSAKTPTRSAAQSDNGQNISVVRTSLKLGAAARPKSQPVVLPPNSRMAQVARSVDVAGPATRLGAGTSGRTIKRPGLMSSTARRRAIDDQIIQPGGLTPAQRRALNPGAGDNLPALPSAPMVGSAKRRRAIRDPQMIQAPRPGNIRTSSTPASAAALRASRFRAAPKGFASSKPTPISADEAYVISTPPKLHARHDTPPADPRAAQLSRDIAELGIDEGAAAPQVTPRVSGSYDDYAPEVPYGSHSAEQSLPGDKAPIGRLNAEYVASGHGGAASEYTTIKEENTSDYSFSRKTTDQSKPYVPGNVSPFLKSVNVEKRPLSDNAGAMRPITAHSPVANSVSTPLSASAANPTKPTKASKTKTPKPPKASRKAKKSKKQANQVPPSPRQDLPTRPTVIVPSSRRSKAPLFFLILFTIILGAAVGAAAYLCFFQ